MQAELKISIWDYWLLFKCPKPSVVYDFSSGRTTHRKEDLSWLVFPMKFIPMVFLKADLHNSGLKQIKLNYLPYKTPTAVISNTKMKNPNNDYKTKLIWNSSDLALINTDEGHITLEVSASIIRLCHRQRTPCIDIHGCTLRCYLKPKNTYSKIGWGSWVMGQIMKLLYQRSLSLNIVLQYYFKALLGQGWVSVLDRPSATQNSSLDMD